MPCSARTSSRASEVGRRCLMTSEVMSVSRMIRRTSGDAGAAHLAEVGEELVEFVVVFEDPVLGEFVDAGDRGRVGEDLVDRRRWSGGGRGPELGRHRASGRERCRTWLMIVVAIVERAERHRPTAAPWRSSDCAMDALFEVDDRDVLQSWIA